MFLYQKGPSYFLNINSLLPQIDEVQYIDSNSCDAAPNLNLMNLLFNGKSK